jgi:hypothetical protein
LSVVARDDGLMLHATVLPSSVKGKAPLAGRLPTASLLLGMQTRRYAEHRAAGQRQHCKAMTNAALGLLTWAISIHLRLRRRSHQRLWPHRPCRAADRHERMALSCVLAGAAFIASALPLPASSPGKRRLLSQWSSVVGAAASISIAGASAHIGWWSTKRLAQGLSTSVTDGRYPQPPR